MKVFIEKHPGVFWYMNVFLPLICGMTLYMFIHQDWLFAFAEKAVCGQAQMITLSTSAKNYPAVLHFYIEQMGMQFWNARLFKSLSPSN